MFYFLTTLVCVIVGLTIYVIIRYGSMDSETFGVFHAAKPCGYQYAQQAIPVVLKKLNCEFKERRDEEDHTMKYDFLFQSGHFTLSCLERSCCCDLVYLHFYELPVSQLDAVSNICNIANINENSKVVYSIDEEEQKINLHVICNLLIFGTNRFNVDVLVSKMFETFEICRRVIHNLQNDKKESLRHNHKCVQGFVSYKQENTTESN